MNPFANAGTPVEGTGLRGFKTEAEAEASARAQLGARAFAVMHCRGEWAWVAPAELAMMRLPRATMAGISMKFHP